nr:uncharacterized protein C14orf119 isoform X2 [Bombyx mori]XP_012544949.2 uncharacterized protein C14orf119 isoform X2 [Bombyx mori]
MSAQGLTSEAQLRYLLQWFGEFSELQREDFLPVLAASRSDNPEQLAATMANMTCQDKPVSLFQCRIKLFNEWFPTWSREEQDRFVNKISEIDSEFGEKLHEIITDGPKVNGTDEPWINEQNVEPEREDQVPENIPVEIVAAS